MTTPLASVPRKLPVWSTVGACYSLVARNLGQLVRISWLWLLIMLPVYAAAHWLIWPWTTEGGQAETLASQMVATLPYVVELPFLASIAVAWHRFILQDEPARGAVYLRLDRTVWLYVLVSFAFLVLVQAPMVSAYAVPSRPDEDVLGSLVPSVVGLLLAVAMGLIATRLSVVLPAIALGDVLQLSQAWRMTRANTLRLAFATLLCLLPALVPLLPSMWYLSMQTRADYVAGQLIFSLGYAVLVIFSVTLLSLAYRFFTGRGRVTAA